MGGLELHEVILDEGQVEEETGIDEDAGLADEDGTAVVFKEGLRGRGVNFEFDCLEHILLHSSHMAGLHGVTGHVREVAHDRRINFLELGGDEHGSDAQHLELIDPQDLQAEVAVDDVDRDEESFGEQVELHLDDQQPVD